MFNKINIILALALLMAMLFPVSEILLSKDKFGHFPVYQSILFILPYVLLSVAILKKYEKTVNLEIGKSLLVLFVLGNILAIDYFFRLGLIDIPRSIKFEISSFTLAILSKSYAERQIVGFIAEVILLTSMFVFTFQRTEKETSSASSVQAKQIDENV